MKKRKPVPPRKARLDLASLIEWFQRLIETERAAHAKERELLLVRLQAWDPKPPVPSPPVSQRTDQQEKQLSQDDREAFEYAEKLGKLGLKPNPDGEGVIEIETGELWESAAEYETQRTMDKARKP